MIFHTTRNIPFSPDLVFAAFSDPRQLAAWWGPAGFSNTVAICEFRRLGCWSFVMHGPDGRDYPNENVFAEIEPGRKVVIEHVSEPRFRLTVTLEAAHDGSTVLSWEQAFADAELARRVEHIVVPANEENLDRLTAEILRQRS